MTGVLSSCQRKLASLTADSAGDANLVGMSKTRNPSLRAPKGRGNPYHAMDPHALRARDDGKI